MKEKKKKVHLKLNEEKEKITVKKTAGITLVALVVTIVVLLILAGITINLVLSDDGIFKKAEQAEAQSKVATIEEKANIIYADKQLEKISSGSKQSQRWKMLCKN